ncbi:MAG: preprotein translocase subunit SecA [Gemmataceae bacterium]|nr:preprotein translocase subunit SecA [Gemmataceae bacterium]
MSDTAVAERLLQTVETASCPPNLPYSGRLGTMGRNQLMAKVGGPAVRRLARAALLVPRIRHFEQLFGKLSPDEIKSRANQLRGRSRAGDMSREFIAEGFGLCSVAVWRMLGMRAFDVQLAAGHVMFEGALTELATGEGKTLTAAFPVFLRALAGRGAHVATVNDYLAKRDAELMTPVYQALGLSVGFLQQKMEDGERKKEYRKDVTYGTASEFGFDFLRDRLKRSGGQVASTPFWGPWTAAAGQSPADPRVQRGHYFALVDEADSIFVDEAKTPLIISAPTREAKPEECVMYFWADDVASKMTYGEHFTLDVKKDKIEVTESGRQLARYSDPPSGPHAPAMDKLVEAIEKAIQANHRFVLDHHYMVIEGKVVIVDESTGRPMPDRHWREGLHQAVEAKEKVAVHLAADHAASITYQSYFRQYEKLAGMTGTVVQNWKEIRRVYKLWVVQIPTNVAIKRKRMPDVVFATEDAKFDAIVAQTKKMREAGRPVLIGTRSVEKSEALSARLTAIGIPHRVLNARQDKEEALIISQAGQQGTVTVATNMAGRGTDIKLGPGVAEAGGLHVVGTERHEAVRIDRQLLGRAGRQGDPGTGQMFLSMQDKLLEALSHERHLRLVALGKAGGNRNWNEFRRLFIAAQRKTERKHYRQRLDLMHYERQRKELLGDLGADPFVD